MCEGCLFVFLCANKNPNYGFKIILVVSYLGIFKRKKNVVPLTVVV